MKMKTRMTNFKWILDDVVSQDMQSLVKSMGLKNVHEKILFSKQVKQFTFIQPIQQIAHDLYVTQRQKVVSVKDVRRSDKFPEHFFHEKKVAAKRGRKKKQSGNIHTRVIQLSLVDDRVVGNKIFETIELLELRPVVGELFYRDQNQAFYLLQKAEQMFPDYYLIEDHGIWIPGTLIHENTPDCLFM